MYNLYIKKYKKNKNCYKYNNNKIMIRISEALQTILNRNNFLLFGIEQKIINLAQLARFLKPLIEARTKKEVSIQAIHMSLSRFQKMNSRKGNLSAEDFEIDNINIQGNLCVYSYERSKNTHQEINELFTNIQEKGGYITISEGINEITVIFDKIFQDDFRGKVQSETKFRHLNATSIGVKFNEKYLEIPGLLYLILQQIALQNINIIEVASTATEIIIYLQQKDAQLAFDTIYNSFLSAKG